MRKETHVWMELKNWEHQEGKKQKIVILPAISEQIIGFYDFAEERAIFLNLAANLFTYITSDRIPPTLRWHLFYFSKVTIIIATHVYRIGL